MTEGHFFEVTAEGELVWEYINPGHPGVGAVKSAARQPAHDQRRVPSLSLLPDDVPRCRAKT